MARTVDPERHRARRLMIIDAALTRFAEDGYERATTAAICREAGISSGTFFHYFPTKLAVVLAIFEFGTTETGDWFAAQAGREDAAQVVLDYVDHAAEEFADPRLPGFIRAIGAIMGVPEVNDALAVDDESVRTGLIPWMAQAQRAGDVRDDLSPARLTEWLLAVVDGYVGRLATGTDFSAETERPMLRDVVRRLLQSR